MPLRPAEAQGDAVLPRLYTNEQLVDDANRQTTLDVDNLPSVLAFVLGQLPPRVKVFPTENYYYFYFYTGGVRYAGNFRFDVDERDKGLVEFIYFKDSTDWMEDEQDHHATLGEKDGVLVEKVRDLVYSVSFADKHVTFELNDLSAVRPPDGTMEEGETFLGPVADESGVRFFLTFDGERKLFHYVLDETIPIADELVPIGVGGLDHILLGRRTGFAFFSDQVRHRKLLIGVYGPNVDVNNYLDGPFDQLPDNFLKGDELRQAILAAHPNIKAPLDRLGIATDHDYRQAIAPYMEYLEVKDLEPAEKCAAGKDQTAIYVCLNALSGN